MRSFFSAFARLHRRQTRRILVVLVVAPFLVEGEEAGEAHHLAGGAEFELALVRLGEDVDGRALELGALHLAGEGAVPDQFVELGLLGLQVARDGARAQASCRSGGSPRGLPGRSWP